MPIGLLSEELRERGRAASAFVDREVQPQRGVCQAFEFGMPTRELLTPQAVGSLHEGCQVIDFDCRYLYVNDAVLVHAKKQRDELLGRTMLECYPGIEQTEMFATLQRVMEQREEATLVNRFAYPDGSEGLFELRFVPVPRGVCICPSTSPR